MAKGKIHTAATVVLKNTPTSTITRDIEQVVVNGALVDDNNEINPGVNTANLKN